MKVSEISLLFFRPGGPRQTDRRHCLRLSKHLGRLLRLCPKGEVRQAESSRSAELERPLQSAGTQLLRAKGIASSILLMQMPPPAQPDNQEVAAAKPQNSCEVVN